VYAALREHEAALYACTELIPLYIYVYIYLFLLPKHGYSMAYRGIPLAPPMAIKVFRYVWHSFLHRLLELFATVLCQQVNKNLSTHDVYSRYMDAMALITRYGKPYFFVTMTSNLYWDEIIEQLLSGQMPQDRPDIVARVYRAKLRDLQDFLLKNIIWAGSLPGHMTLSFKKGDYHMNTFFWLRKPRAKYVLPMIMTSIYRQSFLIRRNI
jgi:hypothetical protein